MLILQEACTIKAYLATFLQYSCKSNALSSETLQEILKDSCKISPVVILGETNFQDMTQEAGAHSCFLDLNHDMQFLLIVLVPFISVRDYHHRNLDYFGYTSIIWDMWKYKSNKFPINLRLITRFVFHSDKRMNKQHQIDQNQFQKDTPIAWNLAGKLIWSIFLLLLNDVMCFNNTYLPVLAGYLQKMQAFVTCVETCIYLQIKLQVILLQIDLKAVFNPGTSSRTQIDQQLYICIQKIGEKLTLAVGNGVL